jgi:hypothetical protein
MLFSSQEEQFRILLRLSLIALYILVGFNMMIIAAGYLMVQNFAMESVPSTLLRNIIFLLAVAEFAAIFFVRRALLKNPMITNQKDNTLFEMRPYPDLLRITIVIVALCSTISVYGLILLILGERFEILLLFVALSLVGYQFFRLRPRDFDKNA